MSNPPYHYSQPGPSSYYPQQAHIPPQGTPYGYPNPNAPVYNPYAYAMPPMESLHPPPSPQVHQPTSPRMRAQASPRMHAQSSPRMNGAGRGGGGYPRANGPPQYPQNYHPMQMGYHPHAYGQPAPPPLQHTYSYPQKYPSPSVPYSPIHYPVHPENPYAGGWPMQPPPPPQQPHALSPLPKQLNMLPAVGANPYATPFTTYQQQQQLLPRRDDSPQIDSLPVPTPSVEPPAHDSPGPVTVQPEPLTPVEPAQPPLPAINVATAPDIPPPPQEDAPEETPVAPEPTVDVEEPTVDGGEVIPAEPAQDEPISVPTEAPRATPTFVFNGLTPESIEDDPMIAPNGIIVNGADDTSSGGWVVWSRRPRDPTLAPGIIFSTRSRARSDLVQKTLGGAIDDLTPPGSPALRLSVLAPGRGVNREIDDSATDAGMTEISVEAQPPSSAATETDAASDGAATPTPGSPASTQSSISVTAKIRPPDVTPAPVAVTATPDSSAPAVAEDTGVSTAIDAPAVEHPVAPAAAPAVSVSKPLVKSWASLLRTGGGEGSSKSALPTSSVVGISIPAGIPTTPSSTPQLSSSITLPPGARSEVLTLLSRPPDGFSGWGPKIRPRGLVNSGNMCFANAVLQTLVYCPPFYRLFGELGRTLPGPVVGKEKEKDARTPLVDATVQFLKEFDVKEPKAQPATGKGKAREQPEEEEWGVDSFMPTYVYDAMKENKRFETMRGGQQEDAEEFLGFYLDTLEEELLAIHAALSPQSAPKVDEAPVQQDVGWMEVGKKNKMVVTRAAKSTESPITRMFGGKFRSTLRAPHQKDSVMVEDWRSLQLDIQPESVHTIKDALSHLSHPQSVQITSPTRPGQVIDATQTVLIEALPPILVLHLKRFLYDTNVKDVVKIGKKITFERELEIGPDIMASRGVGRPAKYKLFGVLYHHGLSASGGHYTLDVLHPNRELSAYPREAWIRIDDELVSDVRPEDVFGGQERDDRCAYLLFYRRVGGGHPARP